MSDQDLQDALKRLHQEIDKLQDKDVEVQDRLNELIVEVEQQIQGSTDEEHTATLIDKLQQQIDQFETEHPRVTGILNHIMVTLSNMGI